MHASYLGQAFWKVFRRLNECLHRYILQQQVAQQHNSHGQYYPADT
jgi:hypothetical protein